MIDLRMCEGAGAVFPVLPRVRLAAQHLLPLPPSSVSVERPEGGPVYGNISGGFRAQAVSRFDRAAHPARQCPDRPHPRYGSRIRGILVRSAGRLECSCERIPRGIQTVYPRLYTQRTPSFQTCPCVIVFPYPER